MNLIQTTLIPISKLKVNSGQIDGLPKNPRFVKDAKYYQLKESIKDNPEMLPLRELVVVQLGKDFIVIGGNMRLRACKELGYKEVPVIVHTGLTKVQKKTYRNH
jgi:ParB-like chromosome segregation protein Spo0J